VKALKLQGFTANGVNAKNPSLDAKAYKHRYYELNMVPVYNIIMLNTISLFTFTRVKQSATV